MLESENQKPPTSFWRFTHSFNQLERLNSEIKRRTDVVGIFPNEAAIYRLVGALLLEQHDESELQCRYMTLETLSEVGDNPNISLSAVTVWQAIQPCRSPWLPDCFLHHVWGHDPKALCTKDRYGRDSIVK
jgi:hypothetical protein